MARKKTPYEVLGVGPEADKEAVKRAYRKRSRETHPDRGGTKEEFHEVSTAFAVLDNPERRRKYDETGDESVPRGRWEQELVQAFMSVVKEAYATGREERTDVVSVARRNLQKEIGDLTAGLNNLDKGKASIEKVLKRLKDKKGLLAGVLRNEMDGIQERYFQVQSRREDLEVAVAYLSDCKFDFDKDSGGSQWTTMTGGVTFQWTKVEL